MQSLEIAILNLSLICNDRFGKLERISYFDVRDGSDGHDDEEPQRGKEMPVITLRDETTRLDVNHFKPRPFIYLLSSGNYTDCTTSHQMKQGGQFSCF